MTTKISRGEISGNEMKLVGMSVVVVLYLTTATDAATTFE